MNRIWKVIEERKSGSRGMSGQRSGMSSGNRGSMSGRKSGEYEEGVKDGFCAAMDILEEHLKEFE